MAANMVDTIAADSIVLDKNNIGRVLNIHACDPIVCYRVPGYCKMAANSGHMYPCTIRRTGE